MAGSDADRELARRAKEGDVDAYAALLRAHEPAARRLALVVGGSAADVDETVQDAFVKGWTGLSGFREGAPFRPWLLRIVANEARNRRRSASRRAGYELRCAEDRSTVMDGGGGAGTAPSPEDAALAADRRRLVATALADLPPHERDVLACRYLVGLDEAETASVLSVARGTVKSRTSRALARLRGLLPERSELGGD
ncbi:MAG TPA: RNA polymerase sigma factor [Acidimicrobiales bacterium]